MEKKTMNKIKDIIKLLMPVGVLKLKGYIDSKTFEGVYDKLSDVPILNKGYHFRPRIKAECKKSIKRMTETKKNKHLLPIALKGSRHNEFLPFLVSTFIKPKKKCKILDFGGGAAAGYIDCLRHTDFVDFEFHIVETPELFLEAKDLFKDDQVFMYDSIPDIKQVDIVNIGSALQYIDNYSEILTKLLDKNPRFILLLNHFMGDNKTYATKQVNMPDFTMPYLIFNFEEIKKIITKKGYSLIFKSTNYQKLRFDVPDEYKVEDSCNLLFSKISA
jgi:putative methyltransferase (TIGR04325 family)